MTQDAAEPTSAGEANTKPQRGLLGCLLLVAGLGAAALVLLGLWWGAVPTTPGFEREPSPDGRYEIVRETTSTFLDGYTKLWITTHGEQNRSRWFLIAPQVDGTWFTDWLEPNSLMLTDDGAWPESRMPYKVVTWQDVRIETRARPKFRTVDSPDELHRLDVWDYQDSRGRRSAAMLSSNWPNPNTGSIQLVEEGPWRAAGRWETSEHLVLDLDLDPGQASPSVASLWHGITITVHAH